MSDTLLGTLCVAGYLLTGFITMALVARFDKEDIDFSGVLWGTFFWPIVVVIAAVWGICVALHALFKGISGSEIDFRDFRD